MTKSKTYHMKNFVEINNVPLSTRQRYSILVHAFIFSRLDYCYGVFPGGYIKKILKISQVADPKTSVCSNCHEKNDCLLQLSHEPVLYSLILIPIRTLSLNLYRLMLGFKIPSCYVKSTHSFICMPPSPGSVWKAKVCLSLDLLMCLLCLKWLHRFSPNHTCQVRTRPKSNAVKNSVNI